MEKLQTITHPQFGKLSYIELNKIEYFAANECALMLGYKRPADAISAHCKGSVKRRLPTKGGQQDIKFIPESDLWRLIIRSKLPQAEAIEKWIMEEVLPSIRKTGTYTIPTQDKQLRLDDKPYEYFDKTYKGEPVLYLADISHMIGVSKDTLRRFLKKNSVHGKDYHLLKSFKITSFKLENPEVSKTLKHIMVVTRSGFELICKAYRIKMETPALFLDTAVPIPKSQKTKEERAEEMFDKIDNYIEVRIKEKIDTLFKAAFR